MEEWTCGVFKDEKGGHPVICNNMDRPSGHYIK